MKLNIFILAIKMLLTKTDVLGCLTNGMKKFKKYLNICRIKLPRWSAKAVRPSKKKSSATKCWRNFFSSIHWSVTTNYRNC